MSDQIKILLTRESVCQADDVFAPNEQTIHFPVVKTISDLTDSILTMHYLANIFGGNATWVMKNEETIIAVLAQQWTGARFLIDQNFKIGNLKRQEDYVNIHFDYLAQRDPDMVYKTLQSQGNSN